MAKKKKTTGEEQENQRFTEREEEDMRNTREEEAVEEPMDIEVEEDAGRQATREPEFPKKRGKQPNRPQKQTGRGEEEELAA